MRPVRKDELLDDHVMRDYTVYYPSGQCFTVGGLLGMLVMGGGDLPTPEHTPTIRLAEDPGRVLVLDPRAVIARGNLVIVQPRGAKDLPGWVYDWLAEHPEWPAVVLDTMPTKGD